MGFSELSWSPFSLDSKCRFENPYFGVNKAEKCASSCSFIGTYPQAVVDSFASTGVFTLCLLGSLVPFPPRCSTEAGPWHKPGKHGIIIILGQVGT